MKKHSQFYAHAWIKWTTEQKKERTISTFKLISNQEDYEKKEEESGVEWNK